MSERDTERKTGREKRERESKRERELHTQIVASTIKASLCSYLDNTGPQVKLLPAFLSLSTIQGAQGVWVGVGVGLKTLWDNSGVYGVCSHGDREGTTGREKRKCHTDSIIFMQGRFSAI